MDSRGGGGGECGEWCYSNHSQTRETGQSRAAHDREREARRQQAGQNTVEVEVMADVEPLNINTSPIHRNTD